MKLKNQRLYILHATGFQGGEEETTYYHDSGRPRIYGSEKSRALVNAKDYRNMGIASKLYVVEINLSKAKLLKTVKAKTEKQIARELKAWMATPAYKAARKRLDEMKVNE